MKLVPIAMLRDNYGYLVIDGDHAAVVDPSEAKPVLAACRAHGVVLRAVWATHHHHDHVDGITELAAEIPELKVYVHPTDLAGLRARNPHLSVAPRTVRAGDEVVLGALRAAIIENPGHTLGAVSYYLRASDAHPGAVFTGDTLFGAGCGRMFEGDAAMMHDSLMRLAALPEATAVYFGHEYTANNLRFAAAVEPANEAVQRRMAELVGQADAKAGVAISTPSTIGMERATNPFLRCDQPAVIAAVTARLGAPPANVAACFAALRQWKDGFR